MFRDVSNELPPRTAQSLAVDISLAALLGDGIYSFGELLLHPIVSTGPHPFPAPRGNLHPAHLPVHALMLPYSMLSCARIA